MKITYLKTIGFRKFENEFETDLFDVTSITGGNAKGKTNILYAVIWGFLGCNLTGDDKVYIGNKNTDNCYVEIHFIDNLGVNHTLKRLKNKYNNKKNFLLLDEKQISQDELTSYYSDKKLFLSIVNSNYFISRSPADQKALLDKYLPEIDIKEIYNKLDKEEKSILEGCPKNVTKYIQELNDDKKMYEDKIKNLQGKIAYAENFIGEKLDTLKTFDKQEELSLAQQELSFLKTDQKAEARNKQLKIVENLNSQINLYQNQIETLTTNMINGKKTYLSIKNEPISYCPMCKQQLSDKGRLNTIQNMKTDLENDYSNKIKLETELQEIKKNLAVEKCKLYALGNDNADKQKTRITEVENQIKVLEKEKMILIKMDTTSEGNLARGKIGQRQLDEIDDELEAIDHLEDYTMLVMLHHHVYPLSKAQFIKTKWHEKTFINRIVETSKVLVDAPLLIEWLQKRNIHYVFHGHKHLPYFRCKDECYYIGAGSATGGLKESQSRYISYNIVKYNTMEKKMKTCIIFYDDKAKAERQRVEVYIFREEKE